MRNLRLMAVLVVSGVALVLGIVALAWALGPGSSQAGDDMMMRNCPQPGKWAIAVWDGDDGSDAEQALATCGAVPVLAAYHLDPQTGGWSAWHRDHPDPTVSTLQTLDNRQAVIALGASGAPPAGPVAMPVPPVGPGSVRNCPLAGRWAISVWDGQNAVGVDQALANCGPGAVSAAYYLDPYTGGWLRWSPGRTDNSLTTLNNLQGIIALGSAGFILGVDNFGDGSVTSSPAGIDCGSDCTFQSATFPPDTSVVLTATADPGSTFSHWSGCDSVSDNSCTVEIHDDRTVFVTFAFADVKIPETTKVLDETTMDYLIRQEDSTYYFAPEAEMVANLEVGDVMVSAVGEGLLRKVAAVNVTEQEIAVETTDATLGDAIGQGTIIFHETFTSANLQSAQVPLSEASLSGNMAAASPLGFTVPIDITLAPGVEVEGSASFDVELDLAMSFDEWDWDCWCFPLKEVRAIAIFHNDTRLDVVSQVGFSFQEERTVWEQTLSCIPVWIFLFCPELDLVVGVEGSAGAGVETEVTLKTRLAVGVRYDRDSDWSDVLDYDEEFTFSDPELSAEAEFKAYVGLQLSLMVYGVVGPYFGVEGFLRLGADLLEVPWWSLYGGIGAYAGIEAEILGWDIFDYRWGPWEIEWLLAQAETYTLMVNKSGNGVVTSNPAGIDCGPDCSETYNKGTTVTLTATPDSGWQVSWLGCDAVSDNTCTVTVNANTVVTASFALPPTPQPEVCDGIDNDDDGDVDEGFPDYDDDGQADCVDNDDDNDGILDGQDLCDPDGPNPTELENYNGYEDDDGCEDELPGDVWFRGIVVTLGDVGGGTATWWVDVEEVLSGPPISGAISFTEWECGVWYPCPLPLPECLGAIDRSFTIGSRVEVYGAYGESDGVVWVDVCESRDYFVENLGNMLNNPGFADALSGWHSTRELNPADTASFTADSVERQSGPLSAQGMEASWGNLGRLYQDVTSKTVVGHDYKIGGWIKTENVEGCVVIGLDYVRADGWTPSGDSYVKEIGCVSGTHDWSYFESDVFTLPPMPEGVGNEALWFLFDFNNGSGTAWWDDVFLVEVS